MSELKDYKKSTTPTIVVPRSIVPFNRCCLCGKAWGKFEWSDEYNSYICQRRCEIDE